MGYSFDAITNEYFSNYEGSHVMFPMTLAIMYQTNNQIDYWRTAFFTFSFVAVWEVLEVLLTLTFGSFVIFGPDNELSESIEDVVILDLGNGIIGISIALLVLASLNPSFKENAWWVRFVLFLIYGITYSLLSPYGLCQGGSCDPYSFPWGNIVNYFVILIYAFCLSRFFVNELSLIYAFIFNAFVFNTVTIITFVSSAVMVYIASGCLLTGWGLYCLTKGNRRTDFQPLSDNV